MVATDQIEQLQERHAELEQALNFETTRPHPDPIVVNDLKKHKLKIKDEIARLTSH